jgi:hypothetical protein
MLDLRGLLHQKPRCTAREAENHRRTKRRCIPDRPVCGQRHLCMPTSLTCCKQMHGNFVHQLQGHKALKTYLKMPDMLHNTSMRGLPSCSRGSSSNRAILPVPSRTGRAPTSQITSATLSPFVLMLSRPQRFTATVSGYAPLFFLESRCAFKMDSPAA